MGWRDCMWWHSVGQTRCVDMVMYSGAWWADKAVYRGVRGPTLLCVMALSGST